tara:strand:- start:192045 stop:193187 length:1143 start_codon:yes stop_codon:yes gene_type:complete
MINLSKIFSISNRLKIQLIVEVRRFYANSAKKWNSSDSLNVLFITEDNLISKSQIFPFFYYKKELQALWNLDLREINFEKIADDSLNVIKDADFIFFQPWFKKGEKKIVQTLQDIRECNSTVKICFLDVYAPLDLRFARGVEPLVDFYIKKQIFSDFSNYMKATQGDTNLVEYYNRLYGISDLPIVQFNVPSNFKDKLILGPSFLTSREMLPTFLSSNKPFFHEKTIDVHARLATKGSPWYQQMREHSLLKCTEFPSNSIITSSLVSKTQYWRELSAARICFSPFGYGEVCWRDYEAIMCGALLIKPDMSHIKTEPNIFIPFVTYIPVSWDFSDLPEKIEYYLENKQKREEIVKVAYDVIHNYFQNKDFLHQLSTLFSNE